MCCAQGLPFLACFFICRMMPSVDWLGAGAPHVGIGHDACLGIRGPSNVRNIRQRPHNSAPQQSNRGRATLRGSVARLRSEQQTAHLLGSGLELTMPGWSRAGVPLEAAGVLEAIVVRAVGRSLFELCCHHECTCGGQGGLAAISSSGFFLHRQPVT